MYTIASFFAGVGGIELGFMKTGKCQVIYANELDPYAQMTYRLNHPNTPLDGRDIRLIHPQDIQAKIDIIVGGFPCQAFSMAGYRKGFQDERGSLYFELLRMIQYHHPLIVFIENVKNLVTHDSGKTFRIIQNSLTTLGYHLSWQVLNTKDIGNIPQHRERVYIVAFRDALAHRLFSFPTNIPLTTQLSDIINFTEQMEDKYYYTNHCIYPYLQAAITRSDRVYQWRRRYVRENKAGVVPTLTANMGTGGHNVPLILTTHGIRKLTPRETFNVQGYSNNFQLPPILDRHLYKQAGNTVSIPVVERIATQIFSALEPK